MRLVGETIFRHDNNLRWNKYRPLHPTNAIILKGHVNGESSHAEAIQCNLLMGFDTTAFNPHNREMNQLKPTWLGQTVSRQETKTSGLSNPARELEDGAPGFTHCPVAGADSGTFALHELPKRKGQPDRGGSRIIALPHNHYQKAPQIAKGLKAFDLSHQARDRQGSRAIDLEVTVITHPKNTAVIRPIIQARNSSCSTRLILDAQMTWMEVKQGASDCMIFTTTWNLSDGERRKDVKFSRRQRRGVEILGWIKDFRFRTWDDQTYSCDIWASHITAEGFTANVSGSKTAERVVATWIVYYEGKPKVASGTFGAANVEKRHEADPSNRGRVVFPKGAFEKAPTVLVALNQFDLEGGRDMRLGAICLIHFKERVCVAAG